MGDAFDIRYQIYIFVPVARRRYIDVAVPSLWIHIYISACAP